MRVIVEGAATRDGTVVNAKPFTASTEAGTAPTGVR